VRILRAPTLTDDDHYDTPAEIEAAITEACATISREWDDMLDAPSTGRTGAKSALIQLDDHDPSGSDIDRATRVISMRGQVLASLNGWCRVVMEERPITSPKALPVGTDAKHMCAFLARHAEWLSRYNDAAGSCAEELREWAKKVLALTRPPRREWIYLGDCPMVVEAERPHLDPAAPREHKTVMADMTPLHACRGRIRVAVASDVDEAACSEHGGLAQIAWWDAVLGIGLTGRIVGTDDLVDELQRRLQVTVTARTVRRWAESGQIAAHLPFGPLEDPSKPRRAWMFDLGVVLDQVAMMGRQCTMCGGPATGGPMCLRCLAGMHKGPIFKAEKLSHAVGVAAPPPSQPLPACHLSERERCPDTDLPAAWCGCPRHRLGEVT